MDKTAIIVLHYVNDRMTNKCVDSIIENTEDGTYCIIVVDNNSPIPYRREDVEVVRNDNHYAVSGMNKGFYHALYNTPYNFKYIVNFDNDITCLPKWLSPLVSAMEDNPKLGIVGGRQWDEGKTQFNSLGADFSGMTMRNVPNQDEFVVWIQGSFVLMRAEMMKRIGLHDERYKIIYSDSDYCVHALDRGWLIKFIHESEVIHIGNGSYGKEPVETACADRMQFVQKWLGIKFCGLTKEYPFDLSNTTPIVVGYKIGDKQTNYVVVAKRKDDAINDD